MKRFIYADNAATTPVYPEVAAEIQKCFLESWGNPSSAHEKGYEAKALLASARERIASVLGCNAGEIYFTSCGTEADNWAIKGAARRLAKKGKTHIVTTAIEHPAVLNTCKALEKEGFTVTYLPVDNYGIVSPESVKNAITDKTAIVAVMYANNEIGTVEPIAEITKIAHEGGALMFTDAVQAVGNVDIDLHELGVDMLALSGHKLHAPKGIGVLYIKKGVVIDNLIDGGGQENRKRAGTENIPYIVGLAKALEMAKDRMSELPRVAAMRDRLIEGLSKVPYSHVHGHPTERLPGIVNIGFKFIEGESMLLWLNLSGICASTGSACSSASLDAYHVLLATGVPHEEAHGTLRLSISADTKEEDIDFIIETVPPIVKRLREMSPLWEEIVKAGRENG
ncbi:MAG: cysteine desulfurase NifS [Clostridia bacterium]|nr:cysteine desulfurase NifS [Clostridia bacterium]